jgi:hypothetical protein
MSGLAIVGERTTGDSIRTQNVMAASSLSNIVKSSLGPLGLDKMLVDDIGVCYHQLLFFFTFFFQFKFYLKGCNNYK